MSILLRLKRSRFLHANLVVGYSSLVRILSGLLKTKASAVLLGPDGVGLLGIAGQAQMLLLSLGSLSIGSGFLQIASQAGAEANLKRKYELFSTTFLLLFVSNIFFIVAGLLLIPRLGPFVMGSVVPSKYLAPVLISVPFGAFVVSYFQGILFAHGRYDLWSRSNVYMALFDLVAFVAASWLFGIPGALWATAATMIFLAVTNFFYVIRLESPAKLFSPGFSMPVFRELAQFGASGAITSAATYLFGIFFRFYLVRGFGAQINGAYQAVFVISGFYTQVLTNGIWAQLFPLASRVAKREELSAAWSESISVLVCLSAMALSILLIAPDYLISILFSRTFRPAIDFLPLVLLADFFFLIAQPSLGVMLARGGLKLYTAIWCIYFLLTGLVTIAFCMKWGTVGIGLGYLLSNVVLSIAAMVYYLNSRPKEQKHTLGYIILMGVLLVFQFFLYEFFDSGVPGMLVRVICFFVTFILAGLGIFYYQASTMQSLPIKTHVLNIVRNLFMTPIMESSLARLGVLNLQKNLLFKSLPNHYQYRKPALREVVRRGIRYRLDIADFVDWHIFFGFSEGQKETLYALAIEGGVVVDVGANIGETALELVKKVGPSGKVIAFEPDPEIRARLVANVNLNAFPNVVIEPWALSDAEAKYQLFRVNPRNPAGNRIMPEGAAGDSVTVTAVTLDGYLAEKKVHSVSLIKIDVEGFEKHVLEGARATILKYRPALFVEISEENLRLQGTSAREIFLMLEELGYSIHRAGDGLALSSGTALDQEHFDVIALFSMPKQ